MPAFLSRKDIDMSERAEAVSEAEIIEPSRDGILSSLAVLLSLVGSSWIVVGLYAAFVLRGLT